MNSIMIAAAATRSPSRIECKNGKPALQTKQFRGIQVKDADKGTVEAVFATFGVKDYDYDYTLPGAFEDGAAVLISAYGHSSWRGAKPVGKGIIRADESKAWLEGEFFLDTIDGLDTFKTIKGTAELQEWSYGFTVLETGEVTEEMRQKGIWRVIKKAAVYEVCPVMLGAGVGTETLSVKAAKEREDQERANAAAVGVDARRELAKFMKTRARLYVGR